MADKSAVGKTGKPFKMHVDWSKVREFARAIKDPNPIYFDPEVAKKEVGGIPVPVTFLQASAFWTDETSSPGFGGFDLRRILHGEQEFEFFKPIFVGDTLTGVTKIADFYEKEGGRGGKMTFLVSETEYTNQKGEKVIIGESKMAAKVKYDSVKVGDEIPKYVVEGVTRPDFVRYAGASGDFVPLHYDQTFVEAAGIPTVFAQGMFTAGLLSKAVTDYVGVGNVRRFQVRFATRVWPGDVVTCTGKVTNKVEKDGEKQIEGDLIVMNQKGEPAIKGSFRAACA